MAYIGVRKPYIAPFDTAHTGKYLATVFAGKVVSFEENPNSSEATLYADDAMAEADRSTSSYGLTLGTSDLPISVASTLFGHDLTSNELTSNIDDTPAYVGFATIGVKVVDGVKKYEARVYPKTQWSEPSFSVNTRGETVEFQTPSLSGVAMSNSDGDLRFIEEFDSESDAATYIAGKFPVHS